MTEELSTLDRSQLQKLLQYAVQVDPAAVLGKVFKHIGESVISALLVCTPYNTHSTEPCRSVRRTELAFM